MIFSDRKFADPTVVANSFADDEGNLLLFNLKAIKFQLAIKKILENLIFCFWKEQLKAWKNIKNIVNLLKFKLKKVVVNK